VLRNIRKQKGTFSLDRDFFFATILHIVDTVLMSIKILFSKRLPAEIAYGLINE